jgi:predicted dinucleotide-binding enzyme
VDHHSSRHPENLDTSLAESGANASRSSVEEALALGVVFLISIPYGSLPAFGEQCWRQLSGKIVVETVNPYPQWDGEVVKQVLDSGPGATGPPAGCRERDWSGHSISV